MSASVHGEWESVPLGSLATYGPRNGYSGKCGADAIGTPTLRLGATTTGRFLVAESTTKRLYETIEPDSRLWLKPGDLLIQRSNTIEYVGTAAIYDGPPATFVYPDLMMLMRTEDPATAKWIWRYLNSPLGRASITRLAAGAAGSMPKISGAKLKSIPVPLPPLPEQRRIAAILDQADAIRRKRREAVALTEELLRSAFLDMFGDPVTNPKGWPVVKLEQAAVVNSGITKNRRLAPRDAVELPYMRVANVQDGYLDLDEIKTIPVARYKVDQYLLQVGDVLLTEGGDPDKLGRGAVWQGQIARCVHQNHIFSVRVNRDVLAPEFASAQIGSDRGKRYFLQASKQTTGIASINKTQLLGFPMLLPPFALQRDFEGVVERIRSVETQLTGAATVADDLFHSLVQRAFRGDL